MEKQNEGGKVMTQQQKMGQGVTSIITDVLGTHLHKHELYLISRVPFELKTGISNWAH